MSYNLASNIFYLFVKDQIGLAYAPKSGVPIHETAYHRMDTQWERFFAYYSRSMPTPNMVKRSV